MKKILAGLVAAALLTTTAAQAAPRGHWQGGHGQSRHYGGHRGNDNAALGFGLFALGALAIISASSASRDRGYDDGYYGPPPPPRGYSSDYPSDYGYGYRDRY